MATTETRSMTYKSILAPLIILVLCVYMLPLKVTAQTHSQVPTTSSSSGALESGNEQRLSDTLTEIVARPAERPSIELKIGDTLNAEVQLADIANELCLRLRQASDLAPHASAAQRTMALNLIDDYKFQTASCAARCFENAWRRYKRGEPDTALYLDEAAFKCYHELKDKRVKDCYELRKTLVGNSPVVAEVPRIDDTLIDPSVAGLHKQIDDLTKLIRQLKVRDPETKKELRTLREQIASEKNKADKSNATTAQLQRSMDSANAVNREKDDTIKDLVNTLAALKLPKLKEQQLEVDPEPIFEYWPNVQKFRPAEYKEDMARRLTATPQSDRFQTGNVKTVQIQFNISKDGRPQNILVSNLNNDDINSDKFVSFIERSGPFRPLISPDLKMLKAAVEFVEDSSAQIHLRNLQIQALGN